jgi:hypothetical protein
MFERSRVDSHIQQGAIPAKVVLDDGVTLKGRFVVAVGRGFAEVLNGPGAFLEFEPYGGERQFIAKASIRSLQLIGVPAGQSLNARLKDADGFDPHAILGVRLDATPDEIRNAYHARAKTYHPDRYANAELPGEVSDYLASMARRVNAAYAALEEPIKVTRRAAQNRAEPVYTSPVRG